MGKGKVKEKIGIITLNGYHNYGNRLQAYATQELLRSLGFEVNIVVIKSRTIFEKRMFIIRLFKLLGGKLKEFCKFCKYQFMGGGIGSLRSRAMKRREKVFKNFSNKYLSEMFYKDEEKTFKFLIKWYDSFVVGSDQVWNPRYLVNKNPSVYFLEFARKTQRIAFAPSFGISKLPPEYKNSYKKWLSGFKNISVREKTGAKIIEKLIGKAPVVLLDPTMMLSKKQWLSISKEARSKPKKNYILTYFLGDLTFERERRIIDLSRNNNLEVVRINDLRDKKRTKTDPCEFIDYINSAKIVLTDSFHGVAFSIIMGTPFIVFERVDSSEGMYSRIQTLLNTFNLNDRKESNLSLSEEIFRVDFSHVDLILKHEKSKSIGYLKKALGKNSLLK